jgi:hypothetical protein
MMTSPSQSLWQRPSNISEPTCTKLLQGYCLLREEGIENESGIHDSKPLF